MVFLKEGLESTSHTPSFLIPFPPDIRSPDRAPQLHDSLCVFVAAFMLNST
ncbi:unnamed protein product [Protopolystoma xenopodis]|uniref:Uncharacterized protein n=1 Tax=Protopolystoma xenopodis TaxID=117903 RepID=A0A3S5CV87_9PLAT|nr:unnamed protein product [Protopolystoma xenopodis]